MAHSNHSLIKIEKSASCFLILFFQMKGKTEKKNEAAKSDGLSVKTLTPIYFHMPLLT